MHLAKALETLPDTAEAVAAGDTPVELARRAATLRHLLEPVDGAVPDAENTALNETPDPRSAPRRRADAFTELLRRYLNSGGGPVEGGERPHLSLLIRAEDLAAADGAGGTDGQPRAAADRGAYQAMVGAHPVAPGWLPWVGPISAAAARRIACDCELTAVLLDDNGVPLNLGRSQRLVSPQQRRALIAQYGGCAFPGCGRPPAWTQAHHIRHWINGGTTDLANLVLLCAAHHRTIHHHGWAVIAGDDGHAWFLPPKWMDARRQPRPAHNRQPHPRLPA